MVAWHEGPAVTSVTLRGLAVAIAVAGIVDPVLTFQGRMRPPLAIVVVDAPTLPVSDRSDRRVARAQASARELQRRLADDFDAQLRIHDGRSRAAACSPHGACIIVSTGTVPERVSDGADLIGAVRLDTSERPRLTITRLDVPRTVALGATGGLRVGLSAAGARGVTSLQVFDGQTLIGEAQHAWPTTADSSHADVAVTCVPLGDGIRRLRVVASPLEGEETLADNEADVGVEVTASPAPVLMYEPEATWTGTFVRRALQADARFVLNGGTEVAPRVFVSRGDAPNLSRAALARVGALIVTAPERLSTDQVQLLDRFVRIRGGTLIVALDRKPSGPVLRLLPPLGAERREAAPVAVGPLRAREILTFKVSAPGTTTLESANGQSIVVARALGQGRILVSGALDAWRFRGSEAPGFLGSGIPGFSTFWTGLVAEAVTAAAPTLDVRLARSVLSPGDVTEVEVTMRSMDDLPRELSVEGALDCPDRVTPVRLWPGARRGTFIGTVEAGLAGLCVVGVTVDGRRNVAPLLVAVGSRTPVAAETLDGVIAAHGGIVVTDDGIDAIVSRAREKVPASIGARTIQPMHSPWWIVPLAACLGGEWWLRRKAGKA